jgi:hypothetical protein
MNREFEKVKFKRICRVFAYIEASTNDKTEISVLKLFGPGEVLCYQLRIMIGVLIRFHLQIVRLVESNLIFVKHCSKFPLA